MEEDGKQKGQKERIRIIKKWNVKNAPPSLNCNSSTIKSNSATLKKCYVLSLIYFLFISHGFWGGINQAEDIIFFKSGNDTLNRKSFIFILSSI